MPRFALSQTGFRSAKTGRTTDCITNHWTRGETATLLNSLSVALELSRIGFARVSSIVIHLFERIHASRFAQRVGRREDVQRQTNA